MAMPSRALLIIAIVAVLLSSAFAAESAANSHSHSNKSKGSKKCRDRDLAQKCKKCYFVGNDEYCDKCKDPHAFPNEFPNSVDDICVCDSEKGYGILSPDQCDDWKAGLTTRSRRSKKCPTACVRCSQYGDYIAEDGFCVDAGPPPSLTVGRRLFNTDEMIWA